MKYLHVGYPESYDTWFRANHFPSRCEEHVHVRFDEFTIPKELTIRVRFTCNADIMRLFLATDAVRRMGVETVHLHIPYVPYARQDRVCYPGEALSAAVFAKLINAQGYDSVHCWDCHSDVMPALIDRCTNHLLYRATADHEAERWRPSIHMPRWASRITLEVESVRVERLQEISREDAAAEGVCIANEADRFRGYGVHRWPEQNYETLWNLINGPGSWDANPWVWVVTFKRIQP